MADDADRESVERVIAAPAEAIFALVSDPARHHEFDGSGTVRRAKVSSGPVGKGSTFTMGMKLGVPYSMVNTIIEFEPGRRIAWQTRPPGALLGKFIGGRIWRYELEPVDGGTRVREIWDISEERHKKAVEPMRKKARESMEKTLSRIEGIVTTPR